MKPRPEQKRLSQWELNAHLPLLKGWQHEGPRLVRVFKFRGFPEAASFVKSLARPAERLDHHPDVDVRYNRVRVELTTHDTGGVSELDVELAKAINKIKV